MKTIEPGKRRGCVTVPSSKSLAHRELIAAALSKVPPPLVRGWSDDLEATRRCLKAICSGEPACSCGGSGTTLRLLTPIAGVLGWKGLFECNGRLEKRPRIPFEKKLRYVVPGNVSSQFVSGLLMALPLADWDSEVAVDGPLQSAAYVQLTEDVLAAAGVSVERVGGMSALQGNGNRWKIHGGQRYRISGERSVEGDWSQAAFFMAMGVGVEGLNAASHQSDRVCAELMARLTGATEAGRVLVISVAEIPDLMPVLAACAAGRCGETRFTDCARLRFKESDRLESTCAMVNAVGGQARIEDDSLIVYGDGSPLHGGTVLTCGDHRIAMSAAVLATFSAGMVTVDDEACVSKSYPDYWRDFESLERTVP